MNEQRLDLLLVARGCARSRTEAKKLVEAGCVQVVANGIEQTLRKVSARVADDVELRITALAEQRYVSRAGLKLEAAITEYQVPVTDALALDVGQSTGGFTDCLLQHGAACVIGVDVGHDQLAESVRSDARVICVEGYNARQLLLSDLPEPAAEGVDLVVMDVSFISQHLILPQLPSLLKPGGWLVSLVKPQFEAGKAALGKNGIVKDEKCYEIVEARIRNHLTELGFSILGYRESPVTGGDGNREFLVAAVKK